MIYSLPTPQAGDSTKECPAVPALTFGFPYPRQGGLF